MLAPFTAILAGSVLIFKLIRNVEMSRRNDVYCYGEYQRLFDDIFIKVCPTWSIFTA
jgi:hypothetical protein